MAISLPVLSCQDNEKKDLRPNVLFLVIDDLNDWNSVLDRNNPIKMPNLEKLAKEGVLFTHAYCSSPACNPSRASVMTGLRPHHTGIYGNKSDWRAALPDALTIQQYFMKSGYYSVGAGKVFHHHWDGAFHDTASFNDFQMLPKIYPDYPVPEKKLNGFEWYGSRNTDWGNYPAKEQDALDYKTASYGVDFLSKTHDKPFFLSIGIFRPHMPFYAPQAYFDKYPLDNVMMPPAKDDDWNDLPLGADTLLNSKKWFWQGMEKALKEDSCAWIRMVTAYQACATFADAQVGRILDALGNSQYKNNTVIVLWSDNGFHLGEKQHIEKFALWEKTTHVPLIFVAPGRIKAGIAVKRPVDLTAIYPTLIDLCGLDPKIDLDGKSLISLLNDSNADFPPALMTYMKGNHAIRTERWRYIQYANGTEELYDHLIDQNEWNNLAGNQQYQSVLDSLKRFIPEENTEQVPDMVRPSDIIETEYKPILN
ncbi:MAG: sulfatase [Mangrovibacterium sp.]